MNKTITIYELLGLVKDGKAPEKITFDTEKYIWEKVQKEYRRYPYDNNLYYSLWSDYDLTKCLNDTVEITEDNDRLENNIININEFRNIGKSMGQAYRGLLEGFIEGWNNMEEKLDEEER